MARGSPHIVGCLVGIPFAVVGGFSYTGAGPMPSSLGLTIALFGVAVIVTGWYVRRTSPTPINFGTDEEIITKVKPDQLVALIKLAVGILILGAAGYLLFLTEVALLYPTIVFTFGFAVLLAGLVAYWKNTLTIHYVTTQRVISEYRFVSLQRQIIQVDDIIGLSRTQSTLESLLGYGSVLVSSGGGNPSASQIIMGHISDSRGTISALQTAQEGSG